MDLGTLTRYLSSSNKENQDLADYFESREFFDTFEKIKESVSTTPKSDIENIDPSVYKKFCKSVLYNNFSSLSEQFRFDNYFNRNPIRISISVDYKGLCIKYTLEDKMYSIEKIQPLNTPW